MLLLAVLCIPIAGFGQSAAIPWWTLDGGGGSSAGSGFSLLSSVGQAAIGTSTGGGLILESGYLPGARMYSGTTSTMSQQTIAGWNMLSVPLLAADMRRTALYPGISVAYDYSPTVGYTNRDTLRTGTGYWMKYPSIQGLSFSGMAFAPDTVDVVVGWNLIGMISYPALISDVVTLGGTTVGSPYYGYLSTGYYSEDTLKPGLAYWVKCSAVGKLVVRAALSIAPMTAASAVVRKGGVMIPSSQASLPPMNLLSVRDGAGEVRSVYYATAPAEVSLDRYELPPPAPSGLDVRFASQRFVEAAKSGVQGAQTFPLRITGETFPLTLSWNVAPGPHPAVLEISVAGKKAKEVALTGEGSVQITDEDFTGARLRMEPADRVEIPREFNLQQNFPNPFNPTTTIRYDLPRTAQVMLRVFDMLGREVAVLVDEEQEAGYKSLVWNADNAAGLNLSSGVYFLRLQAGDYTMMRKLMLVR
jgi:hypothetical protein